VRGSTFPRPAAAIPLVPTSDVQGSESSPPADGHEELGACNRRGAPHRLTPARYSRRRHHGPGGARRVVRSIHRLRSESRSTQRKHTPTSWWWLRRSRLATTVRSPQHQQPGSRPSPKSPSTAVRVMHGRYWVAPNCGSASRVLTETKTVRQRSLTASMEGAGGVHPAPRRRSAHRPTRPATPSTSDSQSSNHDRSDRGRRAMASSTVLGS